MIEEVVGSVCINSSPEIRNRSDLSQPSVFCSSRMAIEASFRAQSQKTSVPSLGPKLALKFRVEIQAQYL